MQEKLIINSYAKINLHLDVGNLRPDGYHDIFSVFQTISLHDTLKISAENNKHNDNTIIVKGNFTCSPEANLIYKAAEKYKKAAGIEKRLIFEVDKIIPEGGGLGGGSGNAAAALKGLDVISGKLSAGTDLHKIAAEIGSDVPFFLKNGTAAASGRGEKLDYIHVPEINDKKVIIIYPGFKIRTSEAYAQLDEYRKRNNKLDYSIEYITEEKIKETLSLHPSKWPFFNSFTEILLNEYNSCRNIFEILDKHKADFISITGSGSSIYGIFEDHDNLNKAFKELNALYADVWISGFTDNSSS